MKIKALFLFSAACLALSIIAHFSTFMGINPMREFPPVFALHILIFVVFVPVVTLDARKYRHQKRVDINDVIFKNNPRWVKYAIMCFFMYVIFNFVFTLFFSMEGADVDKIDGKKVLHSHGKVIREISDKEFELHQAYLVRLFSGHWILFFGVSAAAYNAVIKGGSMDFKKRNDTERL